MSENDITGEQRLNAEQERVEEESRPEVGETKRLYRSRTNRVIGGVAGGIGEYLGIDPTVIRIVWVVLALAAGAGIIAYIIAWIVIPERPPGETVPDVPEGVATEIGLIIGLVLIGLGLWFFLRNLNLIPPQIFVILRVLRQAFWAILLIFTGFIVIVVTGRGRGISLSTRGKTLSRSRKNRRIAGVAGGLGEYFGIDPTLIRLAWVAFTIALTSAGIISYIIAAIVIPEEPKS